MLLGRECNIFCKALGFETVRNRKEKPKVRLAIREFPKIRGTLFWGPYNKDPTISGTISGSPIFGNAHKALQLNSTP